MSTHPLELTHNTYRTQTTQTTQTKNRHGEYVSGQQTVDESDGQDSIRERVSAQLVCVLCVNQNPDAVGRLTLAVRNTCQRSPWREGLFAFLRVLKDVCPDIDTQKLRELASVWHNHARITRKDGEPLGFTEVWEEVCSSWPKVREPATEDGMENARQTVDDQAKWPPEIAEAYPDAPKTRRLLAFCWALGKGKADGVFFLACRKAGELCGVSHTEAARILKMFRFDGWVEVVAEHTFRQPETKDKATEYRFIGKVTS